jgi:hypothetical protein
LLRPDGTQIATACDKFAEDTTGTIPQVLLRRGNKPIKEATVILEGPINGSFDLSWISSNQLLAKYKPGEGETHLPSKTNFDGTMLTLEAESDH